MTVNTGDNAAVYTGIRDVTIYAGETSPGNRLPGGPYHRLELVAIAAIGIPALLWARANVDSGYALPVLAGGASAAVLVTIALRLLIPKRRPSLATRIVFAWNTIHPPHRVTTNHARRRQL